MAIVLDNKKKFVLYPLKPKHFSATYIADNILLQRNAADINGFFILTEFNKESVILTQYSASARPSSARMQAKPWRPLVGARSK